MARGGEMQLPNAENENRTFKGAVVHKIDMHVAQPSGVNFSRGA